MSEWWTYRLSDFLMFSPAVYARMVERYHRELHQALKASQVTPRVVAVRWAIEELRVSTFAQSVGAKGKVSAKRITEEIDQLFAGHLD